MRNFQNIACSILRLFGKTNNFFTFSRKLEVMSNNNKLNKEAGWRLQIY